MSEPYRAPDQEPEDDSEELPKLIEPKWAIAVIAAVIVIGVVLVLLLSGGEESESVDPSETARTACESQEGLSTFDPTTMIAVCYDATFFQINTDGTYSELDPAQALPETQPDPSDLPEPTSKPPLTKPEQG